MMEVRNCMKFSTNKDKKYLGRHPFLFPIFSLLIALFMFGILPVSVAKEPYSSRPGSISIIYGAIAVVSLALVAGYLLLIEKKEFPLLALFVCIFIVNSGYFALSIARTLEGALLANRISYFSAFLPLLMLLIVMDVCRIQYHRLFPIVLAGISVAAFLLAASGGSSSTLYYQEVSMSVVDGYARLLKSYGPLHLLYSVYLLTYFCMMVAALFYSVVRKKAVNQEHVWILIAVVLGNIFVWFVEQLIRTEFEFLSLTYIITEIFLLLLYNMMQYNMMQDSGMPEVQSVQDGSMPEVQSAQGSSIADAQSVQAKLPDAGADTLPQEEYALPPNMAELFDTFSERAEALTPAERKILKYYAEGREISEVAELAYISIHTVRKHNANIYQKLSVGSRDELMLYLELFRRCGRLEELILTEQHAQ